MSGHFVISRSAVIARNCFLEILPNTVVMNVSVSWTRMWRLVLVRTWSPLVVTLTRGSLTSVTSGHAHVVHSSRSERGARGNCIPPPPSHSCACMPAFARQRGTCAGLNNALCTILANQVPLIALSGQDIHTERIRQNTWIVNAVFFEHMFVYDELLLFKNFYWSFGNWV
jgi:hypothetical protein